MAIRNVNIWRSVDWFTIILYFVLVACGWLSICGATYNFSDTDFFSFSSFTGKQLVWIGCAVVLSIVLLNIEKKYYEISKNLQTYKEVTGNDPSPAEQEE